MEQLQAFLRSHTLTLESVEAGTKSSSNNNPKTQSPNSKCRKSEHDKSHLVFSHQASTQNAKNNQKRKFSLCNEPHYINRCEQFLNKTIPERKDCFKSSNLGSNCLGKHHMKNCTSSCRCFLCKAKHHTLVDTEGYLFNRLNDSSTPDQIASVTNSSNPKCGNIAVPNDVQSAYQAASLNTGVITKYVQVYFWLPLESTPLVRTEQKFKCAR